MIRYHIECCTQVDSLLSPINTLLNIPGKIVDGIFSIPTQIKGSITSVAKSATDSINTVAKTAGSTVTSVAQADASSITSALSSPVLLRWRSCSIACYTEEVKIYSVYPFFMIS